MEYKTDPERAASLSPEKSRELIRFVNSKQYLPVVESILEGKPLSYPSKKQISKMSSQKKRTVYLFPFKEAMVLKLLNHLLCKKYNYLFAPNLYSFRSGTGVKNAFTYLVQFRNINRKYVYKVDVSNYFNSVDVDLLLPRLKEIFAEDVPLYEFFESLLSNRHVKIGKEIIEEDKGIMAGCPIASFLANVYLSPLDHLFYEKRILYARYSDDIIVFTNSEEQREEAITLIKDTLSTLHLSVNPKKEIYTSPGETWEFLGFSYCKGTVDICPASKEKLKGKMHRKARTLLRWMRRKHATNQNAVTAYIRAFNRKLYDNPRDDELTWSMWYFPMINTTKSLEELDHYMQDQIRYIATEKRNKGRFAFTYEDMKALGYRSLVHEYYKIKTQTANEKMDTTTSE